MRGIKFWINEKNKFAVAMLHYTADPEKDPERDGKEWYENERMGTPKATWLKEYEIDFTTKAGKLVYGPEFCDFDPKIHFLNSFSLPEPVEYLISLDFGQRHPTCALVGAWTLDGVLYIIDEYYKPALPSVSSREMFEQFAYLMPGVLEKKSIDEKRLMAMNTFQIRVIDPSTIAKNRIKKTGYDEIPYSIIEEFYDNGWDFTPGSNDRDAGITRVREYFQLDENGKAHLYIFKDKCPHLCWELQHYRYRELSEQQKKVQGESEDVIKKNDDAVDALRYMIMTRPVKPPKPEKPKTRIQRDIENLLKPKVSLEAAWDVD